MCEQHSEQHVLENKEIQNTLKRQFWEDYLSIEKWH